MVYVLSKEVTKRPKTQTSISNSNKVGSLAIKQISVKDEIDTGKIKTEMKSHLFD